MPDTNLSFDRFANDAKAYINKYASDIGHSDEPERAYILWRAVMHTIRDRIHVGESFDLMSQLPMILAGTYIQGWKYHESPPLEFETIDEMKAEVKKRQERYGEMQFDWDEPTTELISMTLASLDPYFSEGQMEHLRGQLPDEVGELVSA